MAGSAGRRAGAPAEVLAARARTCVGMAIWRRAARTVAACGARLAACDVGALLPTAVCVLRAKGIITRPREAHATEDAPAAPGAGGQECGEGGRRYTPLPYHTTLKPTHRNYHTAGRSNPHRRLLVVPTPSCPKLSACIR